MEQSKQNEILTVAREAIRTEADALEKMERSLDEHFVEAIEMILQSRGKLIITGMGKSGLIGRKMAATFASTGTPSFYLHPGEAFHGDLGMISKEDIVLAISYSGETDEVLKIVPFIHNNGNRLISMTGNNIAPAFYMVFIAVIALVAMVLSHEHTGRDLTEVE